MTTITNAAAFLVQEYGLAGMKLQKILYYAQALALTTTAAPLFPEHFEAWRHGPVNRQVWEGELGIADSLTFSQQEILRATWQQYGHLSAYELSELSHADAPWQEAREGLSEGASGNQIIPQQTIENFYLARQLVQRPDGHWEHAAALPEQWRAAKLQQALRRKAQGRLAGKEQQEFLHAQVVATQRLEGITV